MRNLTSCSLILATALVALTTLAGCPGGGIPGRGGSSSVDPDACGNYADVNDAGRKLHAFLDATATLDKTVRGLEVEVRTGCDAMAKELGIKAEGGDNKAVCDAVLAELKKAMSAGIKAEAKLDVQYTPAVCTINIDAGASAAAECEAKASGDISVQCEGTCSGTCNGKCDGTCAASGGGGDCAGQCDGTCEGSCSGGCEGAADVDASAECKATAEAHATAEMTCTEAKLEVTADASVVVSKPDYERAIAAIKAGMPHILEVRAKIKPLTHAVATFVATGKGVVDAGKDLAKQFKDQALCLSAQISAAASAMANIQASFSFSVEVSVEASASAGVE
jgi:hypothetical protein